MVYQSLFLIICVFYFLLVLFFLLIECILISICVLICIHCPDNINATPTPIKIKYKNNKNFNNVFVRLVKAYLLSPNAASNRAIKTKYVNPFPIFCFFLLHFLSFKHVAFLFVRSTHKQKKMCNFF